MRKNFKFLMIIYCMFSHFVFLQCPEDSSVDQQLVKNYKINADDRDKYNSWWHKFLNNKNYTAAKEAQKQLDNEDVKKLKDDNDKREEHGSFWSHVLDFRQGSIGDRWRQYRIANKAQNEIEVRQKEIRNTPSTSMDRNFIKNLIKPYEIQALQPEQIETLCSDVFSSGSLRLGTYLEQIKIKLFTPEQISYFTPEQIKSLNFQFLDEKQRQALTKEQIQAITADQIEGVYKYDRKSNSNILVKAGLGTLSLFTPEQISWFSPEQVGLWTDGLVKSLDEDQIKELTSKQFKELDVAYLSLAQRQYLTNKQISSLSNYQIQQFRDFTGFMPDQVSWFKLNSINSWTEKQILSLEEDQLKGLSNQQLEAIKKRIPYADPSYFTTGGRSLFMKNKSEKIQIILNKRY